ncbi:YsnF/AvaK domain-containing protein [Pontibacter harenae]|uniref:YsnF/AvaK domain-containing protein n=1 Tax=Pontibacter harenae TaxID=2894083 RepID=UPI001E3FE22A|nr:YsnF/AvaK domain-containing protein [Pontibacter harenae]MCC9167574.1 YsnF/AvaK domain-containing protein [Pontibacter harenae]
MEQQTVIGIFEKGIDAQMAAQKLESTNFAQDKVDVVKPAAAGPEGQTTASATTSATATRTDNDHTSNFFNSLFEDKDDANKYSEVARRGWVVTVHATSKQEAERASEILDSCGAVDVEDRSRQLRSTTGVTGAAPSTGQQTTSPGAVPIIEEKTNIGKREVESGGVRLKSRIIERPVHENLRLREERVNVERNPVNRPATDRDLSTFKEGETTVTAHSEIPMVNKEARVVEEVKVGKESRIRNERIEETERKTDVEVDKLRKDDDLRGPQNPNRR